MIQAAEVFFLDRVQNLSLADFFLLLRLSRNLRHGSGCTCSVHFSQLKPVT